MQMQQLLLEHLGRVPRRFDPQASESQQSSGPTKLIHKKGKKWSEVQHFSETPL
jgi:hypothetical protein